jgi:hypothetical protein
LLLSLWQGRNTTGRAWQRKAAYLMTNRSRERRKRPRTQHSLPEHIPSVLLPPMKLTSYISPPNNAINGEPINVLFTDEVRDLRIQSLLKVQRGFG